MSSTLGDLLREVAEPGPNRNSFYSTAHFVMNFRSPLTVTISGAAGLVITSWPRRCHISAICSRSLPAGRNPAKHRSVIYRAARAPLSLHGSSQMQGAQRPLMIAQCSCP